MVAYQVDARPRHERSELADEVDGSYSTASEPSLQTALRAHAIGGAALDVTDPEPLPPTHALYACPNAPIVPHIGSATHETRRAMARLAADNLLAGLRGDPLLHCANPSWALRSTARRHTGDSDA